MPPRGPLPGGDQTAFLGEVVELSAHPEKPPLVLHRGAHRIWERIVRGHGLTLAATPMRANRGDRTSVTGELTAPERRNRRVAITLRDGSGRARGTEETLTDDDGCFSLRVQTPQDLGPGPHRLETSCEDARGRALLEVGA